MAAFQSLAIPPGMTAFCALLAQRQNPLAVLRPPIDGQVLSELKITVVSGYLALLFAAECRVGYAAPATRRCGLLAPGRTPETGTWSVARHASLANPVHAHSGVSLWPRCD